ncbi:hypothetical protein COTS27_01296 [Spirochaetota bacterium]|nr:hypothetical protein COTS27_01296 [Spirochaetota bacterium]
MIYKNIIPPVLEKVCERLKESKLFLPSGGDSRIDSAEGGQKIISVLQNIQDENWAITFPNVGKESHRSWYDVLVDKYYCDIKISELKSADNTNASRAIYYFITGIDKNIPQQSKPYFKSMKENENEDEDRDYYYIIINKSNTDDIFVVSLKGIEKLRPAGNNLPFQVNWDNCRRQVHRNWQSARDYLLKTYAQSLKQRMHSITEGLPQCYPEIWDGQQNNTRLYNNN